MCRGEGKKVERSEGLCLWKVKDCWTTAGQGKCDLRSGSGSVNHTEGVLERRLFCGSSCEQWVFVTFRTHFPWGFAGVGRE
jgi:hypothetical protein